MSQPQRCSIPGRTWTLQAAPPKALALIAAGLGMAGVIATPLAAAPQDTGPKAATAGPPSASPSNTGALDPSAPKPPLPGNTPAEREAAYASGDNDGATEEVVIVT